MKYTVPSSLSLLEALTRLAPQSSKTTLRSWIKEGRVLVDGEAGKIGSTQLSPGQVVEIGLKKCVIRCGIRILFEDEHLVLVDKPSGILSVATDSETDRTVHSFLKERYAKVYVNHRLDRETSGVMLFALSEAAYYGLNAMFERHDLKRCYTGVVEGKPLQDKGSWESYLYEDAQFRMHSSLSPEQGSLAKTYFEVKRVGKRHSLVEFTLETGKKNQIRVHCQNAGHSLAGDKKYGAKTDPFKRLALHAHLLSFKHPISSVPLHFHSPYPKDFTKF